MKDVLTPAAPGDVRAVIKKCLENAALVNYTKVSETVRIEGEEGVFPSFDPHADVSEVVEDGEMLPTAKLGELVKLAELCVDLVQENNDYYSEVSVVAHVASHCRHVLSLCLIGRGVNNMSLLPGAPVTCLSVLQRGRLG